MVGKITPKWKDSVVELASRLWKEGRSAAEIAKALGPGYSKNGVISKAQKDRENFPVKAIMGPKKIFDLEKMADLWNNTELSSAEIAKVFGNMNGTYVRGVAASNPEKFKKRMSGSFAPAQDSKPKPKIVRDYIPMQSSFGVFNDPELDGYERARLPGVSLLDNTGCKYPLTKNGPHMFCGCDRVELKSYCAYHVAKCAGVGTVSERRAVKDARKAS